MSSSQTAESHLYEPKKKAVTRARGRPRAGLACVTCRLRKIKCDFQTAAGNICSACRSSGTQCVLNRKDHHRKCDLVEDVLTIRERLQFLETLLAQKTGQGKGLLANAPAPSETIDFDDNHTDHNDDNELVSNVPPAIPSRNTEPHTVPPQPEPVLPSNSQPRNLEATDTSGNLTVHPTLHNSLPNGIGDLATSCTMSFTQAAPLPSLNLAFLPADFSALSPPEPEDSLRTHQSESPHGATGFYGPTSQCHLQVPDTEAEAYDDEKDVGAEITIELDSPNVQRTVLDSYWKNNELWFGGVDKDLFSSAKAAERPSEYYSRALEDAMLACGSQSSTSSTIRKVGRKYVDRAKMALLTQLEVPTLATIQGLLLVSAFEAGNGRNRTGWLFCGMALRLVFDLGLHENCSGVMKSGHVTAEYARYKHRVFLAAFLYDTIWGWFTGRPRSIPLSSVTLALSSSTSCGCDHSSAAVSHLHAWARLCLRMAQVEDVLNDALPLETRAIERLSRLYTAIRTDYASLPPHLVWNDVHSPALDASAYTLHTQYCAIQLVLHRLPSRNSPPKQQDMLEDREVILPGFTQQTSEDAIHENAVRIARVVQLLGQIHGVEQMVPTIIDNIFLAAMALIRRILRGPATPADADGLKTDGQWLHVLADALDSVQRHYHMACRIQFLLSCFVENTALTGMFKCNTRRADRSVSKGFLETQVPSHPSAGGYLWGADGQDMLMGDFSGVSNTLSTINGGFGQGYGHGSSMGWQINTLPWRC